MPAVQTILDCRKCSVRIGSGKQPEDPSGSGFKGPVPSPPKSHSVGSTSHNETFSSQPT